MKNEEMSISNDVQFTLVGTYKEGQLAWIKRHGIYNYPVKDEDELKDESCAKIKELWLYASAKGKRHCFAAEFVGIQTKEEFLAANPTYKKLGPCRHAKYMVFKTTVLDYGPTLEGTRVFARVSDFTGACGRTKKVTAAIQAFKAAGDFGLLADYLPSELGKLPREQLCVCEAAVQMDFYGVFYEDFMIPRVENLVYAANAVHRMPKNEVACPQTAGGRPFRMGEFFCGPGGLACGAMSAEIENPKFRISHACANDFDRQTCNTYAENICRDNPETVICHDVRTLRMDDPRLTPIDGFAFGFPCNDFSLVGEQNLGGKLYVTT